MRYLIYSDLQAHDGTARCFRDPSIPLQRWRVTKFYEDLATVGQEHSASGLIDLGDTLDDRKSVSLPTIETVLGGLQPWRSTHNLRVTGNHDQFIKAATVTNGRMFDSIFDVEKRVGYRSARDGTAHFILAAFPGTGDDTVAAIVAARKKVPDDGKPVFLLGHFTVKGARLNSGPSESGLEFGQAIYDLFDFCIFGDIHKPQQLAPNAHYVGSPFQQDFGEAYEDKRVGLLDTKAVTLEWIPMPNFPQYRAVRMDEYERLSEPTSEDRYKVVLHTAEEATRFYAHPLSHRAEAEYQYTTAAAVQAPMAEEVASCDWSVSAAVRRYIAAVPPAGKGIDVPDQELIEFGEAIAAS